MSSQPPALIVRLGFAAKGVVYLLVGALACMWALGIGGDLRGGTGVIEHLEHVPAGTELVVLLGVGLCAYSFFQFHRTLRWRDQSIARRAGWAVSGVGYSFLAYTCAQTVGLVPRTSADQKTYLGVLVDSSWGKWVAAAFGLAALGAAAWQAYVAWIRGPAPAVESHPSSALCRAVTALGRFGLTARAIIFAMTGSFLVKAAGSGNAADARTTEGILVELARASSGVPLLALVSLGLAAYGTHMLFGARYRQLAHPMWTDRR